MAEGDKPGSSPADFSAAQAKQFAEAVDKIRQRSETAGKALGALGTTAVGAVGIAKFADVFPIPEGHLPQVTGVIAGFVTMAVAVFVFSARLWRMNRPLYMRSDIDAIGKDLHEKERPTVETVYRETAMLNDAQSLRSFEARGWRLQRIAGSTTDKDLRASRLEEAMAILAEVRLTQLRAATIVIRKRAASAATGVGTWVTVGLFVVGFVAFSVGADWLDSARDAQSRQVTAAKACAEATEAIVKQRLDPDKLLPDACGRPTTSVLAGPTTGDQVTAAMEAFGDHYRSCVEQAVRTGDRSVAACEAQLQVIVQAGGG